MDLHAVPLLFHDPTSEPSRAVHWFCLEAGIQVEVRHIFLTHNDHLRPDFLAINPHHQVPALVHDTLRLSEATAIMRYLAEINTCERGGSATMSGDGLALICCSRGATQTCG
jgi:glutathione S-transferase